MLRDIGYSRTIALDGGFQSWREIAMGKGD
jgi:rhodanese-related sulfurtransferase